MNNTLKKEMINLLKEQIKKHKLLKRMGVDYNRLEHLRDLLTLRNLINEIKKGAK